jgi:hypothetical protein
VKESALLSQIDSVKSKLSDGQALGVHSQSRWQGKEEVRIGTEAWRVAQCDSVLELRQRLSEQSSARLVLITTLSTNAVGDDVRARLYKEQLLIVDPWNSLAERFKARQVDPALRQSPALADAALDALGDADAPVAASGILTAELVWQVVLTKRLGLQSARPDLLDFIPWMTLDGSEARWKGLGSALQMQLASWLPLNLGELCPVLIQSLSDGFGPDALAVGLALGALAGNSADSRAMGRLERYTGNRPIAAGLVQQWNQVAERWAARQEKVDWVRRELTRADQILESLGAADFARESRWSPMGFQQRLASFAERLAGSDRGKCQEAYAQVSSHEGSRHLEELRGRRERAEMAMRLSRWLERPPVSPSLLEDAVARYEQDGSWVDWARHQLLAGDEPEGVSRSYRKLFDKVTARRELENRHFGELLSAATGSNSASSRVLLVEDVIGKIVAPLAKRCTGGVLFVVMDGMSLPVWRELSEDLSRHGWLEWAPEDGHAGPTFQSALAVLPSATTFSRTSLLCGALMTGTQNTEKRGFQDNSDLRASKPVLFHKDEVGSSGTDLSEALRLAISKNTSAVVGVVLNVIDDSLGGPEQLSIQWNLRSIAVLQTILSDARTAGRVVILASDHGHVLDHGSRLDRKTESADRWRPVNADSVAGVEELLIKGNRVLTEGHQMIGPTSETIRYTANRRLGYHGGLTEQECIAPLAVLAPELMEIEGWEVRPATPPDWWFEGDSAAAPVAKPRKVAKAKEPKRPAMPLFEQPVNQGDWVDELLASEVFAQQMETFAGRLKKDQVEQYLRVLSDRNLVLLKTAFAQRLDVSVMRVDGLIASLQRVLNVESYQVLSVDSSQTIRLNLQLLRDQFGLGDTSGR